MQRVAFVMRVKEGQQEEYIRRHQQQRAGVHKMSIFMFGLQLFLYMEVEDYAEAARILAESDDSVRWEEYMAPIMESATGETYDPDNAYPKGLPEVFYWQAD